MNIPKPHLVVRMTAKTYEEICKVYAYVEHTCTFMYAVNSFTFFEIGKETADGLLILMLVTMLCVHFIEKLGIKNYCINHVMCFKLTK